MARLIYSAIASLDGYVVDGDGSFDWATPDLEEHAAVNDQERSIGTYLYGRRMYEVMKYWATAPTSGDETSAVEREYAQIWQAADKVIYSTTLADVDTPRTRLEPVFDAATVRQLVDSAAADVGIGGPTVARAALAGGLVDEVRLYLHPVSVGSGTPVLPTGIRLDLDLIDERRFASGVVYLGYRRRDG